MGERGKKKVQTLYVFLYEAQAVEGHGGSASGRVLALCLYRPGSIRGMNFGFFTFRLSSSLGA